MRSSTFGVATATLAAVALLAPVGSGAAAPATRSAAPREVPTAAAASPRQAGANEPRCEFIGSNQDTACMLPFPNNYFTRKDDDTRTGRVIRFQTEAMPANASGVHIDAAPYARNDGFSPGQTIVAKVPGLDNQEALRQTDPVGLRHLQRYADKNAPVVVIDKKTGERWPIWVEVDANAAIEAQATVLIHPAVNFAAKHTYIVAMRKLRDRHGDVLRAPKGFRYYRDDIPSDDPRIDDRRKHFERIFASLGDAGIKRSDLYLAWDFTVASDANNAGRVLSMRNRALAQLGDDDPGDSVVSGIAPEFDVESVNEDPRPGVAREIQGHFRVPCFLAPSCADDVDGVFELKDNGKPARQGGYSADFICLVPDAATGEPARPVVFGHGLFGTAASVLDDAQVRMGNKHNMVFCATTEIGLSQADLGRAAKVLSDMGNFPIIGDRLQQALLNEVYLGRLMANPAGLRTHPAFHADGRSTASPPVFSTNRVFYRGISLGGILGGAFTAIAPDTRRSSLVVNGMNFSVLLSRSQVWADYGFVADQSYPNRLEQALGMSIIQMLWDRGEANGYAHRMTSNPLPRTPKHKVIMNVAIGDFLVTTFQADVLARTIGAKAHVPALYPGRWPDMTMLWGVDRIDSYPFKGSGYFYWDSGPLDWAPGKGVATPPITNVYPTVGEDPHGMPGADPVEQRNAADFLRNPGKSVIKDVCHGPCYLNGFTGP